MDAKQIWYTSKDGTKVPMFVFWRKDLPLDGNRPVLLTGYGGFNLPSLPAFNPMAAWGGLAQSRNVREEAVDAWTQPTPER